MAEKMHKNAKVRPLLFSENKNQSFKIILNINKLSYAYFWFKNQLF